jgi:hypothetical protein
LYLAVQVRQNTRQSRLGAQQAMVAELGTVLQAQAQNREFATLVAKGLQDLASLDPVEKVRFLSHIGHLLRLYEAVYFYHHEGTLDDRIWKGFEAAIADVMSYPGMQAAVTMRRRHISDAFGAYLSTLHKARAAPIFAEGSLSLPNTA